MQHCVNFSVLEACLIVSFMLVGKLGVFVDSDQRTASEIEIFDHELTESIIGIVHFVIKEEGKVKLFIDISNELIHFFGIDIAQHTLAIKKSRR